MNEISRLVKKCVLSRMLKNAQMQDSRNPEERDVLGSTPQRRRMMGTQQMGVFQHPVKKWLVSSVVILITLIIAIGGVCW